MMTDKTADKFNDSFDWFRAFYDDLGALFHSIREQLEPLGYEKSKTEKEKELYSSSSTSRYLPDPVFVALKCAGRPNVLVGVGLSSEWTPEGKPTLVVVLSGSKQKMDDTTSADFLVKVLKRKRSGEEPSDCFFVPLDEFSADRVGSDDKLKTAIDEKIVRPLDKLLKELGPLNSGMGSSTGQKADA